jgi:ferredoxin
MAKKRNDMAKSNADQKKGSKHAWTVELDADTCSLCEVCARHCPTGAIRLERTDDTIALHLVQGKCNNCGGKKNCEAICPEEAITIVELDKPSKKRGEVLLIRGDLIRCSYCHESFSPNRKLETLGRKGLGHEVNKTLCPICRRTNMVVKLIDQKMVPGGHAKYRSTRDILRQARFRRFQEDEDES